ncbi:MAG: hypothetical protein WBN89_06655 [Prochlorococcaceae cyanobacterium]
MTLERLLRFRLQSRHPLPERASTDLAVQWLSPEGLWEPQDLTLTMPGFRIYLISLLICQHFYLVANARERRIPLERVQADFTVSAREDWILDSVTGEFQIQLDGSALVQGGGSMCREDLAFIEERMKACPVSRNLAPGVQKRTRVTVIS